MNLVRVILTICGIVLAALIVYAVQNGDFWQMGTWLTSDPWGIETLVDLYLGLVISAILIWLYERNWFAVIWIVPVFFLGNVWTVVWFVYRLPDLAKKLSMDT